MKKILILVAIATTLAMAGYITITQPDGTTIDCWVYENGDIDCSQ